jgi:16S rRNA (cytosine1402-N4)-methyltransferase
VRDALHQPVLPNQVLAFLAVDHGRRFVDATVGCGGHSRRILEQNPEAELLGIDRDREALVEAEKTLSEFGDRVALHRSRFSHLGDVLDEQGWDTVDGILLDVGMSSLQLDTADRGFSFRLDGPLDMRMDSRDPVTASQIVNSWSESELTRIFRDYGEERNARRIAREIVRRRDEKPWVYTGELAAFINELTWSPRSGRLPAATRCFQALRIAVNHELEELEAVLAVAVDRLNVNGRLVVISFHSLEDRIVKNFMREEERECVCPPDFPECRCDKVRRLKVLTKKPVRADESEVEMNRRAASARLRAAERV